MMEVMIASSLSLMLLAGLLSTVYGLSKSMNVAIEESNSTIDNLKIRRQFERDLRGVSKVISKSDDEFHFITTDLMDTEKEIYYRVDRGSSMKLIRNEVSGANVEDAILTEAVDGLNDVTFTYFNQLGEEALTAHDTNAIKIDIERLIQGMSNDINRDLQITLIMFRNKIYDINPE